VEGDCHDPLGGSRNDDVFGGRIMPMESYNFREVEKKWIEKFDNLDGYKGKDFDTREKKYVLVEFPYPSGEGLHVGHAFSMTGADVYARFMRMIGFNVLFPMGWDAFGLPAENYAIKTGIQPQVTTDRITKLFKEQMRRMAFSFDWEREINTTLPEYYKWTQWIFTKLFEKGLAHKEEMPINWCPSCKIGLANEEVVDGDCERCGAITEKRNISQWVVKITEYADRLIEGLKDTDFIEKVKAAQVNWIDRKEGINIRFKIVLDPEIPLGCAASPFDKGDFLEVFTTRPDTLEGVEFLVVAPEHKLAQELKESRTQELKILSDYLENYSKRDTKDRGERKKTGVLLPIKVINPLNNREVPVYVADYVSMDFGTGAIMGVPSTDARDADFAKVMRINFEPTLVPNAGLWGEAINKGWGRKKISYHLRDWIFSRQHYWGEPIPMVWCEKCALHGGQGWVPVPEEQLPVVLPDVEKYQPTDTGESPLANIKDWVETKCPKCGGKARRETDTMPNWAGSDWYFLRYCDSKNDKKLAEVDKMKYWLPVDVYIGGDEHNTLHLLYSRFIYQFLYDLGVVPTEVPEPYKKRLSHGVILAPDGKRMSKSKGNVIAPEAMTDKYGTDVVRMYMMFMGPFDATMAWNERSLIGVSRFLERFYKLVTENIGKNSRTQELKNSRQDVEGKRLINKLIKSAGEDLEVFKFNTVIAKLMETTNGLSKLTGTIANDDLRLLIKVIAPFAPFVSQELWVALGGSGSVHTEQFPRLDEKYLYASGVTLAVQVNGKLRGTVVIDVEATEEMAITEAKKMDKIAKYLSEGEIKKVIFIKGKVLNFVVS